GQAAAPQPSLGDGLWLGCYLLLYAGFALLVRHGVRDYPLTTLLDGLTGALCVAALGWAFVVPAVGDAADGGSLAVATALAYPLAGVMLLGVILTALALAGWRPGRAWGLLAAGMTLNAAADVITALEVAAGTDDLAALAGGLWALAFVFVGLAAWQRPR